MRPTFSTNFSSWRKRRKIGQDRNDRVAFWRHISILISQNLSNQLGLGMGKQNFFWKIPIFLEAARRPTQMSEEAEKLKNVIYSAEKTYPELFLKTCSKKSGKVS